MQMLYGYLTKELEIVNLEKDIADQVHDQIEKNQKEYYLREKIKAISKELGEGTDEQEEIEEYKEKVKISAAAGRS
jgi:ATP-dependent Lon protease